MEWGKGKFLPFKAGLMQKSKNAPVVKAVVSSHREAYELGQKFVYVSTSEDSQSTLCGARGPTLGLAGAGAGGRKIRLGPHGGPVRRQNQ